MDDMKKLLQFVLVLAALLVLTSLPAFAHDYGNVVVEIPFTVENGGTAQIISEVNSPVPDETEVTVADGETGKFHIHFDTVGEYSYTVKMKPAADGSVSDDTVYTVKVYMNDNAGALEPAVIVYKGTDKYAVYGAATGAENRPLQFVMGAHDEDETDPVTPPPDEPPPPGGNPRTGDGSRMERNFLIAMLASAGLLILSIVYYDDSRKLLKEGDKEA